MSPHLSTETFQLDLRASPSQQHLTRSRSCSLSSQPDNMEAGPARDRRRSSGSYSNNNHNNNNKLDLYSIPVFLFELLLLVGLGAAAYYLHFEHQRQPRLWGFYCDDQAYRNQRIDTRFTQLFDQRTDELTVMALLFAVPLAIIMVCELVNSMLGSLRFRQVRAYCGCCKLHSITRRFCRFVGAFALGFVLVSLACDLLADTTGRPRPFFAQDCPQAYQQCAPLNPMRDLRIAPANGQNPQPLAQPLQMMQPQANLADSARIRQPVAIAERQWVDLGGQDLEELCRFDALLQITDNKEALRYKLAQLATAWPSYPAAMFSYSILFVVFYLSFVATARPVRMLASILVACLLLANAVFNVQLVKDHYNNWDDVAAGSLLALVIVLFLLFVYLNRFRDSHYYENQKLIRNKVFVHETFKPYNQANDSQQSFGQYYNQHNSADKTETISASDNINGAMQSSAPPPDGSVVRAMANNNDMAMRYFQIPRANYRGAPRPLPSLNQMR